MWETTLFGIEFYNIINWFWIYCFLGWVWESSYVSILNKKLVNRGFVNGPVLTIYGSGALLLYLSLRFFTDKSVAIFFGGAILATLLEYATGAVMEKIFHTSWWDYSHKKFNFKGRICLESSIGWGFFTLILFYVLQPFVEWLVSLYPKTFGEFIMSGIAVAYSIDFGISVIAALHIREKMQNLDDIREEFIEYLQGSRLAEFVEEFKESTERFKNEYSNKRIFESMSATRERFRAYSDQRHEKLGVLHEELMSRFDAFSAKYLCKNESVDKTTRRYLKAYPNIKFTGKKDK